MENTSTPYFKESTIPSELAVLATFCQLFIHSFDEENEFFDARARARGNSRYRSPVLIASSSQNPR